MESTPLLYVCESLVYTKKKKGATQQAQQELYHEKRKNAKKMWTTATGVGKFSLPAVAVYT